MKSNACFDPLCEIHNPQRSDQMTDEAKAALRDGMAGTMKRTVFSGDASAEMPCDNRPMAATASEGTAPKPVQVNAEARGAQPNSGDMKSAVESAAPQAESGSAAAQFSDSDRLDWLEGKLNGKWKFSVDFRSANPLNDSSVFVCQNHEHVMVDCRGEDVITAPNLRAALDEAIRRIGE